ncbi:hypothetical protein SPRG_02317 [Saprolegnia parasitica CBS 223.65]|uniref:Uncharacterized protein n=1 Tax=Saprolegnia parasitica (strain CBS 223.65) TaxID=695850 RepID=A0A067CS22_SAPPC|nr:hypothetical protein SPRG_02317 [Saprolegnia parasitica CBS 223.65]KDO33509.1 hypothetical protein SPRG_02317 [Saprolegnia parasitica CBS 223.65]|eukprot:XP_012196252.1 hypothetical protein SPRG_02317 [Saprolegnia parasitica CBS 223.65]
MLSSTARGMTLDADEAKTKNRQRLRDYRRLQKRQHAFLTQRVRELAAEAATLRCAKPLPWHEVAAVFRDDVQDALATQRSLAAQVAQCGHAASILEAWVRASVPTALASFLPHQAPWTQHRLLAPTALRLQSLSWVTDRLLHNADAVLACCRRQEQARVTLHALSYIAWSLRRFSMLSLRSGAFTRTRRKAALSTAR